MVPSSPAVPAAAMDVPDANEDAWRGGGFRVAGVRSKVFAPPPGHPRRSAQGFLVSLERSRERRRRRCARAAAPTSRCVSSSRGTRRCTARRSRSPPADARRPRKRATMIQSSRWFTTTTQHRVDRWRRATLVRASASTPGRASVVPTATDNSTPSRASASPISPEAARGLTRAPQAARADRRVVPALFALDALDAISL